MTYDAFISYSHEADLHLAAAVRDGLQRLAKPWNRRRALDVFLDQSSLAVSAELGASLETRIDDTRWLIVLLSTGAARSRWVGEEVALWAQRRSKDEIALILTSGKMVWDAEAMDFDFEQSTAVPEQMRGIYAGQRSEPLYLDLRWTKESGNDLLNLTNGRFRDAIATLAAPIHGISKDELEGEDVRQHRRARRLRRTAIAGLAALTVLSVTAGIVAILQRSTAIEQRNLSEARRLAAVAEGNVVGRTDLAMLLAVEGLAINETDEGWAALFAALSQPVMARELSGHTGAVNAVVFSAKGDLVASGGDDGTIRLWDPTTGALTRPPIPAHDDWVWALAFSRDGALASASVDGSIRVWDAPSASLLGAVDYDFPVTELAFSPDGALIAAAATDRTVHIWDVATGRSVRAPLAHDEDVISLAFRSADEVLTVDRGRAVRAWRISGDAPSDNEPTHLDAGDSSDAEVLAAAFSGDRSRIAIAGGDLSLEVWDLREPRVITRLTLETTVRSVALNADGTVLAAAGNDWVVRAWDVDAGTPLGAMVGHEAGVLDIALPLTPGVPDSLIVASAGSDQRVRTWVVAPQPVGAIIAEHEAEITAIATTPEGGIAIASRDGQLRLLGSGGQSSVLDYSGTFGTPTALEFAPDGRHVAVGDDMGGLSIVDAATAQVSRTLGTRHTDLVLDIAFSADGSRIATASADGSVEIWDATTEQSIGSIPAHEGWVFDVAFSPDAALLASGGLDGFAHVWDVSSLEVVHTVSEHGGSVWAVAFDDAGATLLTASANGTALRWDLDAAKVVGPSIHNEAELEWHETAAYSQGGELLATATSDGTITLWNVATGSSVVSMREQPSSLRAITFSTGAVVLLTGDEDGAVRVWPLPSEWKALACQSSGRTLTDAEQARYTVDRGARSTACSDVRGEPAAHTETWAPRYFGFALSSQLQPR